MGKQAQLKKVRKALKEPSFASRVEELNAMLDELGKELKRFNIPPTRENVEALFKVIIATERTENMTEEEFEAVLEERALNFLKKKSK
jgi:hypothetical protein